jgi:hypothetical protein
MRLINTLEISPYNYSKHKYPYPNASSAAEPYAWNEYWLKCISDGGLGSLRSIRDGSFLVDINSISEEELFLIVKKELENIDPDEFGEQIEHLCGGVVIEAENQIIIEPSCCGDLDNLSGWENIFSAEPSVWQQLWIGHPWIFYRRFNDMVELSEYTDLNLEDFRDIRAIHTLSENELAEEVRKARQIQDNFTEKVRSILTRIELTDL